MSLVRCVRGAGTAGVCLAFWVLAVGKVAGEDASPVPKTIEVDCPACSGSGMIREIGCPACGAVGMSAQLTVCDVCHGSRKIEYKCPVCKGEGKIVVGGKEQVCRACLGKGHPPCPLCKGKGKIPRPNPEAAGAPTKPCEACGGTGFEQHTKCSVCAGKGKLFLQAPRPADRNQRRPPPEELACPFCGGDGEGPPICPQCKGKGYCGSAKTAYPCPGCAGTGTLFVPCHVCAGKGFVVDRKAAQ